MTPAAATLPSNPAGAAGASRSRGDGPPSAEDSAPFALLLAGDGDVAGQQQEDATPASPHAGAAGSAAHDEDAPAGSGGPEIWPPLWLTGLPPEPALAPGSQGDPDAAPEGVARLLRGGAQAAAPAQAAEAAPAAMPPAWSADTATATRAPAADALAPALAAARSADELPEGRDQALDEVARAPAAAQVPAPAARSAAAPAVVPGPPLDAADPELGGELGTRLQWMADQKIGHAEIRLNPAELGPVEVRLRLDGDKILADFSSTSADARQAIEQSLPRLREQLDAAGLQLAQAGVGDGRREDGARAQEGAGIPGGASGDDGSEIAAAPAARAQGLLDAYA